MVGSGGYALKSGKDEAIGEAADDKVAGGKAAAKPRRNAATAVQSKDRDMGSALRSVWQKTVDESVPDDMLALLGKLD